MEPEESINLFERHNGKEEDTLTCRCGKTFTWSGFCKSLRPWVHEHAPHMKAPRAFRAASGARTTRPTETQITEVMRMRQMLVDACAELYAAQRTTDFNDFEDGVTMARDLAKTVSEALEAFCARPQREAALLEETPVTR